MWRRRRREAKDAPNERLRIGVGGNECLPDYYPGERKSEADFVTERVIATIPTQRSFWSLPLSIYGIAVIDESPAVGLQ